LHESFQFVQKIIKNTDNFTSKTRQVLIYQIFKFIVQSTPVQARIRVNGRNLSIGMTFIENRAPKALGLMIVLTRR